ncbi:hypothetical protein [Mycolicibacterium hippocampi]|uniref:hypothetical protein n=1 Tax=Mycolicibacterium hippocampi TaxID=659824 RepID=UPI003515EFF1
MSSSRQKAKPVFDPHALDQDLEELWPLPQSRTPPPVAGTDAVTEPAAPPPAHSAPPIEHAPARSATAPTASPMPSTSGGQVDRRRRLASVSASSSPARKRFRPPEVLLSAEVYDELYRVQIAEKKVRRGLARTMGAIVLDAIEAHATRLATTWADQRFAVGEGQLFERPSSNAVPRRRRHATAPRTVVLSGVSAANGKRLVDLVQAWNAGTRSALVEQALRYEFAVLPEH